jgi:phosphoribosylformylglycinamidine synthase
MVKVLERLLASPNLCSRRPIFRRYDHMVGNATVGPPGGDAAVVRVPGTRLGLALTIDGNGRYCELDPYLGAQIAVCEAARNVVATGARPLAVTDCLNFANPDRPEVYWDLEQAVAGISAACHAFGLPVVSGNVSLYNESESSGAIYPTPVVGMVGVLQDHATRLPAGLRDTGDFVLLIGETGNDLGGSEYMKVVHGEVAGRPPGVDLNRERAVQEFILDAHESGLLRSAHDVAEGGMLVALAECCLLGGVGVRCPALRPEGDLRQDALFFAESQGRFVISATPRAVPELQGMARRHHVEMLLLGLSGGDDIEFEGQLTVSLDTLRAAWESGL